MEDSDNEDCKPLLPQTPPQSEPSPPVSPSDRFLVGSNAACTLTAFATPAYDSTASHHRPSPSPSVSPTSLAPRPALRGFDASQQDIVKRERHSSYESTLPPTTPTVTPAPTVPSPLPGPGAALATRLQSPLPRPASPPSPPATSQAALFSQLHAVCTDALRHYWTSSEAAISASSHPFSSAPPPSTMQDYLAAIASSLWTRSQNSSSPTYTATSARSAGAAHPERLQAVHRMSNLYAWGEHLEQLVSITSPAPVPDERVVRALFDARDLCAWCLCEEGKAEIERVWVAWAGSHW
ncbi:MAG: hypothetical protein M1832_003246 [Thelocarpon impressellum]|nr:MAG: hypothetical protein M1832_003246 [Thelocarpon impressellum]